MIYRTKLSKPLEAMTSLSIAHYGLKEVDYLLQFYLAKTSSFA